MIGLPTHLVADLPQPCRPMKPLLNALIDGELSSSRQRDLEGHVNQCGACRKYRSLLEEQERILREAHLVDTKNLDRVWARRLRKKLRQQAREDAGVGLFRFVLSLHLEPVRAPRPFSPEARFRYEMRLLGRWQGREAGSVRSLLECATTNAENAIRAFQVLAPEATEPVRWCRQLLWAIEQNPSQLTAEAPYLPAPAREVLWEFVEAPTNHEED